RRAAHPHMAGGVDDGSVVAGRLRSHRDSKRREPDHPGLSHHRLLGKPTALGKFRAAARLDLTLDTTLGFRILNAFVEAVLAAAGDGPGVARSACSADVGRIDDAGHSARAGIFVFEALDAADSGFSTRVARLDRGTIGGVLTDARALGIAHHIRRAGAARACVAHGARLAGGAGISPRSTSGRRSTASAFASGGPGGALCRIVVAATGGCQRETKDQWPQSTLHGQFPPLGSGRIPANVAVVIHLSIIDWYDGSGCRPAGPRWHQDASPMH